MALAGEPATSPARTIRATDTVTSAARMMHDNAIGDVLVVDRDGRLTGIVTDPDITVRVVARRLDPQEPTVEEICTRDVATVEASLDVEAVEPLMRDRGVHRLPVVNDDHAPTARCRSRTWRCPAT